MVSAESLEPDAAATAVHETDDERRRHLTSLVAKGASG